MNEAVAGAIGTQAGVCRGTTTIPTWDLPHRRTHSARYEDCHWFVIVLCFVQFSCRSKALLFNLKF